MRPKSMFGAILVVIGLIGLYYVFTNDGKSPLEAMKNFFAQEVYEQEKIDLNGIANINVESDSLDVSIVRGSGSEAVLKLQGHASKSYIKHLDMHAEQDGDTLQVTLESKSGIGFGWNSVKLTVELPEHAWNEVSVLVDSGDIQINEQQFTKAELHADSGDIEIENISVADNLIVQVDSGDIEIKDITSTIVELEADSGDISVKDYTAERISFHNDSGDVSFESGAAQLTGEASSGDISLHADDLLYDTELSASSGDVTITLEHDPSSLAVQFHTGSGDSVIRKNGFDYEEGSNRDDDLKGSFGTGDIKLNVETGSGDIVLK